MSSSSFINSAIEIRQRDFEKITVITRDGATNRNTIEATIVKNLMGDMSEDVSSIPSTYTAGQLSETDRKQFIITTTAVDDGKFCLLSEFVESNVEEYSNFTEEVCGNDINSSIFAPSTATADSNIKVEVTAYNGPFNSNEESNETSSFDATFDSVNANVEQQKVVNSQNSTTSGDCPLTCNEDTDFNTESAFGIDQSNYYTANATTGKPEAAVIQDANKLSENNYVTQMTNDYASFDNVSGSDYAGFGTVIIDRLEQTVTVTTANTTPVESVPVTTTAVDAVVNSVNIGSDEVNKQPFILPNTLDEATFSSYFSAEDSVEPGYDFQINVVDSGSSSGYAFNSEITDREDVTSGLSIDDSGLINNPEYMKDLVNLVHSIEISKPTVNITDSNNNVVSTNISLSTGEESLKSANNKNGQIKFNIFSTINDARVDYIDENSLGNVAVKVFYDGDDVVDSSNKISDADNESSYVAHKVVKVAVAEQTNFFKESNGAQMNLFNPAGDGALVNSSFTDTNYNFTFVDPDENTLNEVAVFKVIGNIDLTVVDGLKKTAGTGVTTTPVLVPDITATANIANLVGSADYFNTSAIIVTPKQKAELSFGSLFSGSWTMEPNFTISAASAYSSSGAIFPSFNETNAILDNNNKSINVVLSVGNIGSASIYNLQDNINVAYTIFDSNTEEESEPITIGIPQSEITIVNQTVVGQPVITTIPAANYLIVSGSVIDGKAATTELESHVITRTYKNKFSLPLRGFKDMLITTPEVTATTTIYKLKNTITGTYYTSTVLRNSITSGLNLSPLESLSLDDRFKSFTITSDDLKPFLAQLRGTNGAGTTLNLTTGYITLDLLYGKNTFFTVDNVLSGNVDTSLKFNGICEYLGSGSLQAIFTSTNGDSFKIDLNTSDTRYSVSSFESLFTNLGTNTDLNTTDNALTAEDGFASITTWVSTIYKIVTSFNSSTQTTTLSVQKIIGDSEIFNIELLNNSGLVTTVYVSHISYDAVKDTKTIGNSSTDNSSTISYFDVDPTAASFDIDTGVRAVVTSTVSDMLLGSLIEFKLKNHLCNINLVGSAGTPTSELLYVDESDDGLVFKFESYDEDENLDEYSRILELNWYRGYTYSTYTINRGKMNVNFKVGTDVSQLFASVSNGSVLTVDGLSGDYGSIGLMFNCALSLLADSAYDGNGKYTATIYNAGDAVTFNQSSIPSTTLKSQILHSFSNTTYDANGAFSIKSERVKLNSTAYGSLTNASWNMVLNDADVNIYFSPDYLKNPATITFGEEGDEAELWDTITVNDLNTNGIVINGWKLETVNTLSEASTCFWSFVRPYLEFSQVAYTDDVALPFELTSVTSVVNYVAVSDDGVYNPFSSTANVNDITYNDFREKAISDYKNDASETTYTFNLTGNTYNISYAEGFSESPGTYTSLFSGEINEILSTGEGSGFWINDTATSAANTNSSKVFAVINFSQPTISENETGVIPSTPANILVKICLLYPPSTNSFDLETGNGVRTYLYTHDVTTTESSDPNTVLDYTINAYRYNPVNTSINDFNNSPASKQIQIAYTSRDKLTVTGSVPIPSGTDVSDFNTVVKSRLSSVLNSSALTWTPDTGYNTTPAQVNVKVSFLSQNAKRDIPAALWSVSTAEGYSKAVIVNQRSLLSILNKIGIPVGGFSSSGNVNCPSVILQTPTL